MTKGVWCELWIQPITNGIKQVVGTDLDLPLTFLYLRCPFEASERASVIFLPVISQHRVLNQYQHTSGTSSKRNLFSLSFWIIGFFLNGLKYFLWDRSLQTTRYVPLIYTTLIYTLINIRHQRTDKHSGRQ